MSITGLECAAAVGMLTRQLDFDANLRVRRALEQPVRELFAAAGVTTDPMAIDAVGEWIANGSSVRSLDSGSSRLRRSAAFKQLDEQQIDALNKALADARVREPIANALLVRQRRRNVHSQVRSVLKSLTDHWLLEHVSGSHPEMLHHLLQQAMMLGERELRDQEDVVNWADEVLDFYSLVVKNKGTERPSGRGVSLSTARTYRASLVQFWDELRMMPLLAAFAERGEAAAHVPPLFASLDGSTDTVHLHIERRNLMSGWDSPSPSARSLARQQQRWRANSAATDARNEMSFARMSSMPERELAFAPEFDADENYDSWGAEVPSWTPVSAITVTLCPDGRPQDVFTAEVQRDGSAEKRVASHIAKWLMLESEVELWDVRIELRGGADKLAVQRSGIAAREVAGQVAKLVTAIEELT